LSLALWKKTIPSGPCPLPDAVGMGTKTCWHFGNCRYSLILFNRRSEERQQLDLVIPPPEIRSRIVRIDDRWRYLDSKVGKRVG
jgi:hypothetical protein